LRWFSCPGSSDRAILTKRRPTIRSEQLAAAAAWLADQKKAQDIRIYDVGEELQVADYFVVITGLNRPHVKAIYQELHVRLKAAGEIHARAEGADTAWWVLLDYGDVVVHILQSEAREYYDLDRLYQTCRGLEWPSVDLPELPEPAQHRRAAGE
jgi:ribosome-associated protein